MKELTDTHSAEALMDKIKVENKNSELDGGRLLTYFVPSMDAIESLCSQILLE